MVNSTVLLLCSCIFYTRALSHLVFLKKPAVGCSVCVSDTCGCCGAFVVPGNLKLPGFAWKQGATKVLWNAGWGCEVIVCILGVTILNHIWLFFHTLQFRISIYTFFFAKVQLPKIKCGTCYSFETRNSHQKMCSLHWLLHGDKYCDYWF